MASLAQYSARLHDRNDPAPPAPGVGARWFGIALYVSTGSLVVAAALQST